MKKNVNDELKINGMNIFNTYHYNPVERFLLLFGLQLLMMTMMVRQNDASFHTTKMILLIPVGQVQVAVLVMILTKQQQRRKINKVVLLLLRQESPQQQQ